MCAQLFFCLYIFITENKLRPLSFHLKTFILVLVFFFLLKYDTGQFDPNTKHGLNYFIHSEVFSVSQQKRARTTCRQKSYQHFTTVLMSVCVDVCNMMFFFLFFIFTYLIH